jgi:peptidoglycan/LPS O-acetylase OafA/YrhL
MGLNHNGGIGTFFLSVRLGKNYYFGPQSAQYLTDTITWYLAGFGSAFIVFAALMSSRIQKILSHHALVFLGKISYSIYLTHFCILKVVAAPLLSTLQRLWGADSSAAHLVAFMVTMTILVGVSQISYVYVELPAMKWGRRFNSFMKVR